MLVTGAAGYIGSGLVRALLDEGRDVRALNREQDSHLSVEQLVADIATDPDTVLRACEGAETVVHLAGDNEVLAASQPAAALGETVLATERVVEAAVATGVRRVIYMSTIHVYGDQMADGAPLTEDLRPEPRSVYAISRLASEHLLATLAAEGTDVVVLRLTNSVGAPEHPGIDRWSLVANDLCRQGALTGRLVLRSSGIQWRDFVALRDVHSVVAAACRADTAVPAGLYNLGSGEPMTVRALAELVQDTFERLTGTRPELEAPDPEGERPEPYHVAVERLAEHGLRAETPIESAVEDIARFCIDQEEALAA